LDMVASRGRSGQCALRAAAASRGEKSLREGKCAAMR